MRPRLQALVLFSILVPAVLSACDGGSRSTSNSPAGASEGQAATSTPRPTSTPFPSATPLPQPLASPTPRPQALRVVQSGFGQPPDASAVGWGMIIENPNADRAVTDSFYRISFLDAGGREVVYDTGTVHSVEPGRKLGLGNGFLLIEPAEIASIEIEITNSEFPPAASTSPPAAEQVRFVEISSRPFVTALISISRDVILNDLWVDAVAYDASGRIIGGGFRKLEVLPAGGHAGIVVPVTVAEAPARVEVYTGDSHRTQARAVDPARDPVVEYAAISAVPTGILDGWAAVLRNPNDDLALIDTAYQVTYFDSSGLVVGSDAGLLPLILPGSTTAIGSEGATIISGASATSIEVALAPAELRESEFAGEVTVSDVQVIPYPLSTGVSATLVNGLEFDLNGLRAVALAFDENGILIGAGSILVAPLPRSASTTVEVRLAIRELPARAEVYFQPGLLGSDDP